jgi:CDGSH-type Zn-finger protein/uncharacterized Fe-S cluster protein YjdI
MAIVTTSRATAPSRAELIYLLYEAAELEHTLMCSYLYAAFSLRDGEAEGLTHDQAVAVARWRRNILCVAVEEMGHLAAVWNIISSLGGPPQFARGTFPLEPGALPAGMVVRLAPFDEATIQHFIHLERPADSAEPEGNGFAPNRLFRRGVGRPSLTPMPLDYETVGQFYCSLGDGLRAFVAKNGETAAFCGDPALQLSAHELTLAGVKPVICEKTALEAFAAIVEQGEGAQAGSQGSHFQRFVEIRDELLALKASNPGFQPAFPAAHNPVLRAPPVHEGRVWIENEAAVQSVDLANCGYALMLRLLAHAYVVPRPQPDKVLAVELALGLMHAVTPLAERAARLPAGPSNPTCHAGMTFTALRNTAPLPPGAGAWRCFSERLAEMAEAGAALDQSDPRVARAARILAKLAKRGERAFELAAAPPAALTRTVPATPARAANDGPPAPSLVNGVERVEGRSLTILYEGKKCIHARFCVTGAPNVFLANVEGAWIQPDAMPVDAVVEVAHACPSGAIRYRRKDGKPDEGPPPVNLLAIREAGPYAVRAELRLAGRSDSYRATLCRCGASKNKPYCDGSHHEVGFNASGEPPATEPAMLAVRNGPLVIEPEPDGPLHVRGNLEITSGTGRVVARLVQARLCRCGASGTKPFCDSSHERIGFKS